MSGPSPYKALYEIFGHGWHNKEEDCQESIKKIAKKPNKKIRKEKEPKHKNKKPLKIDNACQTQPLRDYSYNKVVAPSKRKTKKKNKEKSNTLKMHSNDNTKFSSNYKVHKEKTSSAIGMHLKKSHVNALYKTVSDIEKIFREERNLHLHSRKCLCNSCGALGVITESMKHPVDYSDDSSESDDDELNDDEDDEDDDDEYCNSVPRYNSSKKSWKIEYKDNESVRFGFPNAEGYLRLILELEKMIKRVRSLERLALRYNIPIRRNKVDIAFDMQTARSNGGSRKPNNRYLSSTSSSEIDKKQCGLFSIPNVIRRRFSKKRCLGAKEETKNEIKNEPTKLRSKNYKHQTIDNTVQNLKNKAHVEIDKKFQSNCLDEKLQNFDLALLNEDEICELMFHLKNKDLNNTNRMKQKTIIPSNTAGNNRNFFNQKPEIQTPQSNLTHKSNHTPFKMGTSPVGLRTIAEKTSLKSLRNDATFIRKSPNYLENNIEQNSNTRNLFHDFLNINNVTPAEQYNETNTQRRQRVLHRDKNVNGESTNCYNINSVNKAQNDTVHKLNLDVTKHDQKTEKDFMKTSKDYLFHKSSNLSKKDWVNEMLNKSIGVIEEKYSQEMKISDNAIKAKIGKTVTYSKQNEYCYFRDSLIDIKSVSRSYINPIEIGESSGLCNQKLQAEKIESSDSDDLSRDCETYLTIDNIPVENRKISEIFLPVIQKSPQSRIEIDLSKEICDVSGKLKSNIVNEETNIKKVKITDIPINTNNQFKYGPETHLLRSELRSQNEKTCKTSIETIQNQHDKKVAEFISNNIFEKPSIKEKTTERIIKDIQNSYKKGNEESKSLPKSENKTITENENFLRKYIKDTKNIQKSKSLDKYKGSHIKVNTEVKSCQTCETSKNLKKNKYFKRKENKATQITEINEEHENKVPLKKDIVKKKLLRNVENKNVSTDVNFNAKQMENIQKKILESKNSNVKSYEVKYPQMPEVNKNFAKKKISTKKKENIGTQVAEINGEKENIIEEIHECPLSFIFNNCPSFDTKDIHSQVKKKSILKTYRRAINETPLKLDKKNSVVINKFKKHVNLNIVQKVSSSIIHDIFNRKTSHNASLTKVFKRRKHTLNKGINKMMNSRIPIPIPHQIKGDVIPNIIHNPKTLSRIPIYLNKSNNKVSYKNKLNLKVSDKKIFNQKQNNILLHYNAVKNTPIFTKRNELGDLQETIVIGKTIYKHCVKPKRVSFKKDYTSKIPVLQKMNNKKQQDTVCNKSMGSKSLDKSNQIKNYKKTTINTSSIIATNDLSSSFPQNIKLYPAFLSASSSSTARKQEENKRFTIDAHKNNFQIKIVDRKKDTDFGDDAKVLVKNLNKSYSYNSEIQKVHRNIDTDSGDETKVQSVNSDTLNSYNSEANKVERKEYIDSENIAKVLPVDSDLLNSYNSEIEKVGRKIDDDIGDGPKKLSEQYDNLKSLEIEKNIQKVDTNFEDEAKVLSIISDNSNSYNSEIEKNKHKIDTDSSNEAKLLSVDSDILNSYNSQIERVKRKINTESTSNKAKVLLADSDILNSYNSQIERVERKQITDSTDDDKNSNYLTTESIIIPNDVTEEKSYYFTPPYAIETYESSCTFSEGSSGANFIYKSKFQLGTDKSIADSEFDTRISESVYTSTSDLNPSKKNKKWKWLKTFGSRFKSFLSVHTPKSSTVESVYMDGNSSCNVSNEIFNGKHMKKKENEDNLRKNCKMKWNSKPKASVSFTLTLKKKNISSSILLN